MFARTILRKQENKQIHQLQKWRERLQIPRNNEFEIERIRTWIFGCRVGDVIFVDNLAHTIEGVTTILDWCLIVAHCRLLRLMAELRLCSRQILFTRHVRPG